MLKNLPAHVRLCTCRPASTTSSCKIRGGKSTVQHTDKSNDDDDDDDDEYRKKKFWLIKLASTNIDETTLHAQSRPVLAQQQQELRGVAKRHS